MCQLIFFNRGHLHFHFLCAVRLAGRAATSRLGMAGVGVGSLSLSVCAWATSRLGMATEDGDTGGSDAEKKEKIRGKGKVHLGI